MEDHAREMAVSLESLVTHFDLCVTAIKHTEGGGDAALKIAGEMPEGVDIEKTPAEPMDKEQWEDMMRVLEHDASQVEDVVMEIEGHHAEMAALHERVETQSQQLAREHESTSKAFSMLEDIGRKLPGYITQSQVFLVRWDEDKAKIEEHLEELESGREVYDGFLRAYDELLIEVGRRKSAELEMDKVVQAARARLEKLYEDEAEDRAAFKEEHGYFLPSDLWAGFEARPLQFEVLPVNDHAARIPHISASVIR
ncbi:autophagy-related protein 17, partial [Lecanoromycetidae sp. Uapishka_2]